MFVVHCYCIVMIVSRNFIFKRVFKANYLRQLIKISHIIVYLSGFLYVQYKVMIKIDRDHIAEIVKTCPYKGFIEKTLDE